MKKIIVSVLIVLTISVLTSNVYAANQKSLFDSSLDTQICMLESSNVMRNDKINLLDDQNLTITQSDKYYLQRSLFDFEPYNPIEEPTPIDSLKRISLTFLYIIPGLSIEIGYPNVFEGFSFEIDLFFYPALIYFTAFDVKYSFRLDPTLSFGFGFEVASVIVEEDGNGILIAPFVFFKIPYGFNKMIEISVGLARLVSYDEDDGYDDEDDFKWTPAMEFSFGIHF